MNKSSRKALNKILEILDKHCDVCKNRPVGTGKKVTAMREKYCFTCNVYKSLEVQRKKIK